MNIRLRQKAVDALRRSQGGAGSLVHGRGLHVRRGDIRRAPCRGDSSTRPAAVVCKVAAVPPTTTRLRNYLKI